MHIIDVNRLNLIAVTLKTKWTNKSTHKSVVGGFLFVPAAGLAYTQNNHAKTVSIKTLLGH